MKRRKKRKLPRSYEVRKLAKVFRKRCKGASTKGKINIAKEYSSIIVNRKYDYKLLRRIFAKIIHLKLQKNTQCFFCDYIATQRHHIILLCNGGSNHHTNIIPVCKNCHSEIHPWMPQDEFELEMDREYEARLEREG